MATAPIAVARVLAAEYGQRFDPVNYITGVAISGRLRLHRLDPDAPDPAAAIAESVSQAVTPQALAGLRSADGPVHAGYVWANELSEATDDGRYSQFLVAVADLYLEVRPDGLPLPVDPDARVEDIFCAASVLGRAYHSTGDARYAETLAALLGRVHAQPESGLWWHCGASPFYWGRGNAFAALGFSEGLSYLPAGHPQRAALEARHRSHIEALLAHQDGSGAWRQVIDRPDSYLELTATAMIGAALARGIARGWLPASMGEPAARAWAAVAERIDEAGMVRDACIGTGPLPALDDYLTRPTATGHDDRAGSMALWFAVEYASLTGDADAAS